MYKELEKYQTGKKLLIFDTVSGHGEINVDEYSAGLGDLINDFIRHKTKPFWLRKYYHTHLTELYLQMLNKVSITHGLQSSK